MVFPVISEALGCIVMRSLRGLFAACSVLLLSVASAAEVRADNAPPSGAAVHGVIVDGDGGLPIPGAHVEAACAGTAGPAVTTTRGDGSFTLTGLPTGQCVLTVSAPDYQTARSRDLLLGPGDRLELSIALTPVSSGISAARTIGRVTVAANSTLQTSTTINAHVEPSVLQTHNYMRAGDALISMPGVNTYTSSSVGDDLAVSIRGFDPTETATLLDDHPIGPIGAFGNGFDYQVSPFFGIRDIETVFGSGATGIYGASTIAGSVNFQTINPTQQPHVLLEQGIGSNEKSLTGLQATGTVSKLGYAFSHGVEGTVGNFPPQLITQSGLLGINLRASNIAANTYLVSGAYVLRNDVGKLIYALTPRTNLTLTAYSATSWDDKSGNGDNDYVSYPYNLYNTLQGLAANGGQSSVCLSNCGTPSEVDGTCTNYTQAALTDAPAGYSCLPPQVYAARSSGPAGGGGGPWQAIRNQDYHARLTQGVGIGQITLDGYVDHYALDYNRAVANQSFHSDFYRTSGFLLDDEIGGAVHDLTFGYYYQHQLHTGTVYPFVDAFGNITNELAAAQAFSLNVNSVFVRDQYTPTAHFSAFADLWLKHSANTGITSFDPRLSLQFRPTSDDVVRLAAGHSNSEPDPSLLYAFPSYNTTPGNINPSCGGLQTQIGSVSNPTLVPETATDAEVAYGHRFGGLSVVQVDVYDTYENNALFSGNLPLSALGKTQVPPDLIQAYLQRIHDICKDNPTLANLSVSTTYNAAAARFRGIELDASLHPARGVIVGADYDVQSAAYLGVPDSILQQNVTIINGSQIDDVPLHKANLGIEYASPSGFDIAVDGHYIGANNSFNRPAFSFVNASLSQQVAHATFTLGINNIFNSAAQIYGYFGLGVFHAENHFGTDQNAFQQSSERFGLPPSQYFFTVTYRV